MVQHWFAARERDVPVACAVIVECANIVGIGWRARFGLAHKVQVGWYGDDATC